MPLIYDVYNDSTHILTQWLAEARAWGGGEEVPLKTFPISIGFNYEIQFFHENLKSLCYNIRK